MAIKVYKPISQTKTSNKLDVVPIKKDFFSGLMSYGKRIILDNNATNGTSIIYKVPAGKTFFLTNSTLSYRNVAATTDSFVYVSVGGEAFAILFAPDTDNSADAISITFTIPLKTLANESFAVTSGTTSLAGNATITGYEISTDLLPLFI